jgi:RNA polymerase sigma factor (sigma-70 family)
MAEMPAADDISQVVQSYSDLLIRIAFTYMKNKSDAEDAAQTVFMKYLEKKPAFESPEHEKAWFIRVCINHCKNSLKSFWFSKSASLTDAGYGFSAEEYEVMDAILRLPIKYRSVILLHYYEGYGIEQIAELLGQKSPTVASQLHRARKLLKSLLKEDIDE